MALNFDDPRIWDGYIERLISAGTAALAFGEGKPHTHVPQGLHDAARERGFPVLVVPADVPFLHLQNLVHRALAEEEYQAAHTGWVIAEECTRFAADGIEFAPLLEHVASRIGHVLRVVDHEGAVFTGTDSLPWSQPPHGDGGAAAPLLSLPLNIGEDEQWHVHCVDVDEAASGAHTDPSSPTRLRTLLTPAVAVLGMVLSRTLSTGFRSSEKTDALLAALRRTDAPAAAAIVAALGSLGVTETRGMRILSVRARSRIRLHLLSWRLMRMLREEAVVFPAETEQSMLLLLVPFACVSWSGSSGGANSPATQHGNGRGRSANVGAPRSQPSLIASASTASASSATIAESMLDGLGAAVNAVAGDRVIVSEEVQHPSALSLFVGLHAVPESHDTAHSRTVASSASTPTTPESGIHFVGPPSLGDVGALFPAAYSAALAQAILGPILTGANTEEMLDSLSVFIDSPSVAQAAIRLGVHRNTARARRNALETALGIDLASGEDRALCALAMTTLRGDRRSVTSLRA